jgi:uncharacterized alkaline shock family protein YloU
VTRRAIVDIVRSAVQGSYGVIGLADPDFSSRLLRWLGIAERGIRLNRHEGLALDLYLTVAYGVPVAEVARQVDSAVRYAVRHALAREVDRLTIHIDGLRYQPAPASATSPTGAAERSGGGAIAAADVAGTGGVESPARSGSSASPRRERP